MVIPGVRFCENSRMFEYRREWHEEDTDRSALERTEYEIARAIARAMNSISPDLIFTTETEHDFDHKRLTNLIIQPMVGERWSKAFLL